MNCRDCKFWEEQPGFANTQQGPSRVGFCVRFPPLILPTMTPQGPVAGSAFPTTQAMQWCGELTPKGDLAT